jgi:hypothetical protein
MLACYGELFMRRKRILCMALLAASLLPICTASADWNSFWYGVKVDWHRNHAWPEPFRYGDRQSVYAAMAAQTAKGWQLQNTVGDVHFDADSHKLTRAGEAQIYQVLVNSPPQRRVVFVQQAFDEETTEMRMDAVQRTIARMMPGRPMPAVVKTDQPAARARALHANMINEKFNSAITSPVLPAATSGSGGGN